MTALIVPIDGQGVLGWADQSGAGNHATQGGANLYPTYQGAIQNNLPMLKFDGTDDYLSVNGLAQHFDGADAPWTVAIAFKKVTNVGTDALFSCGRSTSTTPFVQISTGAATAYTVTKRDDANVSAQVNLSGVTPNTSFHIGIFRHNGTTVDAWLDGVQRATAAASDVGTLTLDRASIGALVRSVIGDYADAYIGEFLAYNAAISDGNEASLNTYMTDKWT